MSPVDEMYKKLLDLIEASSDKLNPPQIGAILISLGGALLFDFAPTRKDAEEVIKKSIEMAWKDHLRNEQENQ